MRLLKDDRAPEFGKCPGRDWQRKRADAELSYGAAVVIISLAHAVGYQRSPKGSQCDTHADPENHPELRPIGSRVARQTHMASIGTSGPTR